MTAPVAAPSERGWGKLLLALVAFLFLPTIPQMRAFLPIDQPMVLFAPAVAACALVGWWAGGRAFLAIAWMAIAALVVMQGGGAPDGFLNLARGWSLLLGGAFGLVCLFGVRQPLLPRALTALTIALGLAIIMSLLGPVSMSKASDAVAAELAQRNAQTMTMVNGFIDAHPKEWGDLSARVPQFALIPATIEDQLTQFSNAGRAVFPALLALESLAALALAWATYHRLGRTRLGSPLAALKEFRFNDQLVWGLIVGLTIMLLPTLSTVHGVGRNLLVFFGALYAIRGFGVLAWFMTPGSLTATLAVSFVMLGLPVLNAIAALVLLLLGSSSLALGLGDTWADWRRRARPTS
jgi:Predicted membrane protein (DUF2232)